MSQPDLRFCPRCAGPLEWRAFDYPAIRHPACTQCGFVLWQNPKPSVEALIVRKHPGGPEVLLGRRAQEPSLGLWDAPGGFLNAGDDLEGALIRECRREMGVEVRVGELVGAFEDQFLGVPVISLVFASEIASGEPRPAGVIDLVDWFPIHDTPPLAFPAVERAITALRRQTSS
jgi:ADP-ribose pyrophosphatase YjhB (NUDIX family)